MASEAFVYEAIRTPRGRGKPTGALAEVKPVHLVTGLVDELRRRYPELDLATVDDLVLGVVTAVGDQGMDIAKTAALAAGLPDAVSGVQLNRFCAFRAGSGEHGRGPGPGGLGRSGAGRWRRVDVQGADG